MKKGPGEGQMSIGDIEERPEVNEPQIKEPEKSQTPEAQSLAATVMHKWGEKTFSSPGCANGTILHHIEHLTHLEERHGHTEFGRDTIVRSEKEKLARIFQETFPTQEERASLEEGLVKKIEILKKELAYQEESYDKADRAGVVYPGQSKYMEYQTQLESLELALSYVQKAGERLTEQRAEIEKRKKEVIEKMNSTEIYLQIGQNRWNRTIRQAAYEVLNNSPFTKETLTKEEQEIYERNKEELDYSLHRKFEQEERTLLALALIDEANEALFKLTEAKQKLAKKQETEGRVKVLEKEHQRASDLAELMGQILLKGKISTNFYASS